MKRFSVWVFAAFLGFWPGVSHAYVQGDSCAGFPTGQAFGQVPITGGYATLVCDGSVLQYKESIEGSPVQKGIATNNPDVTYDVNGELRPGYTGIACSSTIEGAIRYNSSGYQEFCDGASWRRFVDIQSPPSPTAPSGDGYFVMTATTYDGNLGGMSGADSKCLTELSSTYTDWSGYSDANSRGLLDAVHVKAFLCDGRTTDSCNNLMPLTTYYFATAGNSSAGGASFTTDANGLGPQDNADWSGATYFGGTYSPWTNRKTTSSSLWKNEARNIGNNTSTCHYFTNNTDWAVLVFGGNTASTTGTRWEIQNSDCITANPLICFVNP